MENRSDDILPGVFAELFLSEFLKASAIHGKFWTAPDGSSLYDAIRKNPAAAIKRLTNGRPEKLLEILIEQLQYALIEWALEKMGENGFKSRIELALADFWNRVFLQRALNPKANVVKLARQMSLELPIKTPRTSSFPYDKIKEITETYHQALEAAKRIKKYKGDPIAHRHELDKQWPDVSGETRSRYANMRPSQIALDYTAWKHRIGAELMKKLLNKMRVKVKGKLLPFRYPQDLIDRQFQILKKNRT